MNRTCTVFKCILLFFLIPVLGTKAQSSCNCWIPRDTSFHVVPFAGYSPPYYANDDGSSRAIILPFKFCFWGQSKGTVFINTNGNITFDRGFSAFTSDSFPTPVVKIIAPFWADVDIDMSLVYPPKSGAVYYKITPTYMIVQWDSVGYVGPLWCASRSRYAAYNLTNTFQLIITNGIDPILPKGNNVEFCYGDMQWTTGADSPGPCTDGGLGFKGAPATVGANEGDNVRFVQVGLFDTNSFTYAGQFPPPPSYDGIYWLDGKSFLFNLCAGTIAPLTSGISPCDTFRICVGDSLLIPIYFLAPTQGDSVWSNIMPPAIPGVSVFSNKPGNTDSLTIKVVGSLANLGYNTIHVYGYDNQHPPDTTFDSFVVEVDSAAPKVHLTAFRDTICVGDTSTLTASGGRYYSWSTGSTKSTLKVTPATTQTYSIAVSDGGCTKDTSIQVVVLPKPAPVIIAKPDTVCEGDSVLLIGTGGKTFKWSTGQTKDSIKVIPIATITYTLSASNGVCSDSTSVTIWIRANVTATISALKDTLCPDDSTTITATGGTYKWLIPGNPVTASIQVKPNSTTTYSVIVTTPCQQDTISKTIYVLPPIAITTSGNINICEGSTVKISVVGGVSYLWSPGGATNSSINVTPASTTTYTVAVSNGQCIKDTTIRVTVDTPAVISISPNQKLCFGDSTILTASGGGEYKWSNGTTTSSITVKPNNTISYTVVVTKNGCVDSASTIVTIDIPVLNLCCDKTITPGGADTIIASGALSYIWDPNTDLSCSACDTVIATPSVTTTYVVTANDAAGCTISRQVTVFVEIPCADFMVPNVFTPNNDGRNDDFVINILNPSTYSIVIYDRWGKEVYTSTDPTIYWNGKLMGTRYLVSDGTYYYIIKATCGSNDYTKKGFVEVVGAE